MNKRVTVISTIVSIVISRILVKSASREGVYARRTLFAMNPVVFVFPNKSVPAQMSINCFPCVGRRVHEHVAHDARTMMQTALLYASRGVFAKKETC